jgi:hypothetical protein
MRGIHVLTAFALAWTLAGPSPAAAQPPERSTQGSDETSLNRLRRQLEREPGLKLDVHVPVPTFRVTIEQRRYMLTFEEWLHEEFDLNPYQKKWIGYSARDGLFTPGGVNLLHAYGLLERYSKQIDLRRAREEVARELQRFNDAKSAEEQLLSQDRKQPRYSN